MTGDWLGWLAKHNNGRKKHKVQAGVGRSLPENNRPAALSDGSSLLRNPGLPDGDFRVIERPRPGWKRSAARYALDTRAAALPYGRANKLPVTSA
jgi:hypothetical protein